MYVADMAQIWHWRRPAAVAPIRPLAWEPLCAMGAALKRTKDKYIYIYISLISALLSFPIANVLVYYSLLLQKQLPNC